MNKGCCYRRRRRSRAADFSPSTATRCPRASHVLGWLPVPGLCSERLSTLALENSSRQHRSAEKPGTSLESDRHPLERRSAGRLFQNARDGRACRWRMLGISARVWGGLRSRRKAEVSCHWRLQQLPAGGPCAEPMRPQRRRRRLRRRSWNSGRHRGLRRGLLSDGMAVRRERFRRDGGACGRTSADQRGRD